jgi:citrate synthase
VSAEVHEGLAGVVAGRSAISHADPADCTLTYRGYPVQDLARWCTYEQVAYLILHGDLPAPPALDAFCAAERALRPLSPAQRSVLDALPAGTHPMDALRTALSAGGAEWHAGGGGIRPDADPPGADEAMRLIAVAPTVLGHMGRRRAGADPLEPDPSRGFAENALWMHFGADPHAVDVGALQRLLILYAELSFNASAFTARTVASTGADLHGAVVAAVAALSGPLHGGANEEVWRTMQAIGDPARAGDWLRGELAAGRRISGFGHRVYRRADPRAAPMREALNRVAAERGGERWIRMHDGLVEAMAGEKGIPANVDLAAGPACHLMGFDTDMFTPLFAMGRIAGWCAHALEQRERRQIVHPLAAYTGPPEREVPT